MPIRIFRNWLARRRLRIRVHTPNDDSGRIKVEVHNSSGSSVIIQNVGTAWPYRGETLRRRLKAYFKHGQHWQTIGWIRHSLTDVNAGPKLPLKLKPGRDVAFELPVEALKAAWHNDRMIFVVRLRDSRGRNYYSPIAQVLRSPVSPAA